MTRQVFTLINSQIATTNTRYGGVSGYSGWSTAVIFAPVALEGTIIWFAGKLSGAPGVGKSYIYRLYGDDNYDLTFADSATEASGNPNMPCYTNDYFRTRLSSSGGPAVDIDLAATMVYFAYSPYDSMLLGYMPQGNGVYNAGMGYCASSPEYTATFIVPCDAVVSKMRAFYHTAPGASTYTLTMRVNGVNSALAISHTGASQTADNLVDEVSLSAGDEVSFYSLGSSDRLGFSVVWRNLAGNWPIGGTIRNGLYSESLDDVYLLVSGAYYSAGGYGTQTWESLSGGMVVSNLYIKLSNAPGNGNKRIVTLAVDGVDTNLKVEIEDTDTTGNLTGIDVWVPDGSELSLHWEIEGTPAFSSHWYHWGMSCRSMGGFIWVEGDYFAYLDQFRIKRLILGDVTGGTGTAGQIWFEGDYLHYIDSSGNERRKLGTSGAGSGVTNTGQIWIDMERFHYIDADGDERKLGQWLLGESGLGEGTILEGS